MPFWAWLALLFFLVSMIGSLAYAAVHARRAWRIFGAFSDRASESTDALMRSASSAEAKANALTQNSERFAAATERLQRSLAELAVLKAAFGESKAAVQRLRGVVPLK